MSERKITPMFITIILNIIIFIYLVIASYVDIKTYTLPLKLSVCIFAMSTFLIVLSDLSYSDSMLEVIADIGFGIIPGVILLFISYLTHENIGYGDGLVIVILGVALKFKDTFVICSLAFLFSAIVAVIILTKDKLLNKKTTSAIPFIPFILISYTIYLLT